MFVFVCVWVCDVVCLFLLCVCGLLLLVMFVLFGGCPHFFPMRVPTFCFVCSRVVFRCDIVFPRVVFLLCHILCVGVLLVLGLLVFLNMCFCFVLLFVFCLFGESVCVLLFVFFWGGDNRQTQ